MAITVEVLYKQFPHIKPRDVEYLVGSNNYDSNSIISLKNAAQYDGEYARDLSIFAASKEGKSFTELLNENKKAELSTIVPSLKVEDKDNSKTTKANNVPNSIPMDKSVFDIANKKQKTLG